MLDKHFTVNINIRCTSADVVALAGSFAEHVEANHADGVQSIEVRTNVFAAKAYPPIFETPTAPVQEEKPKRTRGRVKPEASAEQQADLPLPAVDGAEAEPADTVTTYAEPEVVEPANAGTRELTRDDGFSALRGLIERKGNDAAKAALAKLGYVKFSDVPTERMGDLLDAVDEVGA